MSASLRAPIDGENECEWSSTGDCAVEDPNKIGKAISPDKTARSHIAVSLIAHAEKG